MGTGVGIPTAIAGGIVAFLVVKLAGGPSAGIGAGVGMLIGVVSGIVVLLVIRFAVGSPPPLHLVGVIVAKLLALAGFWAGGNWLGGNLFQVPDHLTFLNWYWGATVVSFLVVIAPMLVWLSLLTGSLTRIALEQEAAELQRRRGRR